MNIEFEDRTFEFSKDAITVDEWRQLKRKYGMTPKGFEGGIDEADPDAYTFLYWVMLRQAGDQRALLGDHLKPNIVVLNHALNAAFTAEAEAEAGQEEDGPGEDPTKPPRPPSPARSASPPGRRSPAPPPSGQEGAALTTV